MWLALLLGMATLYNAQSMGYIRWPDDYLRLGIQDTECFFSQICHALSYLLKLNPSLFPLFSGDVYFWYFEEKAGAIIWELPNFPTIRFTVLPPLVPSLPSSLFLSPTKVVFLPKITLFVWALSSSF